MEIEMADQEDGKRTFLSIVTLNMPELMKFWVVGDYITVKRF